MTSPKEHSHRPLAAEGYSRDKSQYSQRSNRAMKWKQWILSLSVLAQLTCVHPFDISAHHSPLTSRISSISRITPTSFKDQNAKKRNLQLFIALKDEKDRTYGEDSRRFRRTSYTHEDWPRHRAPDRLLRNFVTILNSGIFRQLLREVGLVVTVSMALIVWNCAFVVGFDDFVGQHHGPLLENFQLPLLELPTDPFTLSSPALGLLLVFRTDTSFARWDEARKAWGSIVNHSRNIMRCSAAWVMRNSDTTSLDCQQSLDTLGRAVWAFPRTLQRQLLGAQEDDMAFQRDVRRRLEPQQAESLIRVQDKPSRALHELSKAINALPIDYLRRMQIDQSVVQLVDALGTCERIFSSPVPLVYTRHTARFVTCWMFMLPFALWTPFESTWNHMGMVPSGAVIAFFLFGIEELAVQLEEPFSILPLDVIVNKIDEMVLEYKTWNYQDDLVRTEASFVEDFTAAD